ncbi:MAG TPA: hypothetical protein VGO46_00320 [Gemmatimonadaceae bacterium]|jgi:hypothetical protein|nr:hypothetical protein [Gemmatimonadaceae bacterium]
MRADISSRTTFIYKFIFPAIWISLFGFVGFLALKTGSRGTGTDKTTGIIMAAAWFLVSALLLRTVIPLMRVQLREGRIYVSNYRREIEIEPSEIERITQNVWINVRPITLHLRHETSFGTRIRFLPPSRAIIAFWKEDPIVDQLRRFAGLLPPRT